MRNGALPPHDSPLSHAFALEPRFMFDAAGAATAAAQADHQAAEQAAAAAQAEAATQADAGGEGHAAALDKALADSTPAGTATPAATNPADTAAATPAATAAPSPATPARDTAEAVEQAMLAAPAASGYRELVPVEPDLNGGRREVVFIDSTVGDWQTLAQGVRAGVEVVLLDGAKSGMAQMADWAQRHAGYDAIHLVSHGWDAQLHAGTDMLWTGSVDRYAAELKTIGDAVAPGGEILLYGCQIAENETGRTFVDRLHALTGSAIAASADVTGSESLGRNWAFEVTSGTVLTTAPVVFDQAAQDHFAGSLADYTVTTNAGGAATTGSFEKAYADVIANGDTTTAKTIAFDASVFDPATHTAAQRTITLSANLPSLTKDISINGDVNGDGVADVVIDGNAKTGIFVTGTANVDVTLASLELKNFSNGGGATTAAVVLRHAGTAGSVTIRDSIIHDNSGTGTGTFGGAVAVTSSSTVAIDRSVFYSNTVSGFGGALALNGTGGATVTNSVFYNNFAGSTTNQGAGAINVTNSTGAVVFANLTIVGNNVVSGGVAGAIRKTGAGSLTIYDSLISGNTDVAAADITGTVIPNNVLTGTGTSGLTGYFLNLGSGAARDLRLASGSAAIDAGSSTAQVSAYGTSDLLSNARLSGTGVDLGAYEYAAARTLDLDGGSAGNNYSTTYVSGGVAIASSAVIGALTGDTNVRSARITLASAPDGAQESLTLTGSNSNINAIMYDSSTLTLVLYSKPGATVADMQAALANVKYVNSASSPTTGTRSITVTLSDASDSNSATTTVNVVANTPPTIGNLAGDSVAWAGVGNTVRLDAGTALTIADTELGTTWTGASLTVNRVTSGTADATANDVFGFDTAGASFTVSGSTLQSGGQTFATFTSTGGVLTVSFTSSGTTATQALVQEVMQRVTYRNDTPYGNATMRFSLSDGTDATTADVTVTSSTITVDKTTEDSDGDAADGFSLREALARGVAQSGADTIVIGSSIASGSTITLSSAVTVGGGDSISYAATGTGTLTIGGSGISLGTGGNATFSVDTSDTLTVSSVISGTTAAVTKSGTGTLTLSGINTYTGATTISAGTLTIDQAAGSGLANTTAVTVASGATLNLLRNETVGSISGAGTIELGTNVITVGASNVSSTFSGTLHGDTTSSGLVKQGSGTLTLSGTNSYGTTAIMGTGTLGIASASNLGSGAITFGTTGGGGTLSVTGDATLTNAITLSSAATVSVASGKSVTLSGAISGTAAFTKSGSGTLTYSGTATNTGNVQVTAGTLLVTGSFTSANTVSVSSGATLGGTGSLTATNGIVMGSNSTLAPGVSGAGTLTLSGGLTLQTSATLAVDINGATAGTGYDQVVVTGAVSIGGALLSASGTYSPSNGDVLVLISNDGSDAITGSLFSGVAEGGSVTANGATYTVSYAGGTGNDVALTYTIVNNAPSFSGNATLTAVAEDTSSPSGATVTSLFGTLFSDPDSNSMAGVAIAGDASTSAQGTWQYSLDGTSWSAVGTVSTSSALLLSAATSLRFLPAGDYNGTPGALTVYAVDNSAATTFTDATTRRSFDTTTDGSSSKVSASGVSLGTSVTAVEDAPSRTGTLTAISVAEDSANANATSLGLSGVGYGPGGGADEAGQTLTYTVTGVPSTSFVTIYKADGTTVVNSGDTLTLAELQGLTYKTTADGHGTGSFTYTVADSGGGSRSESLSITVTSVNDAPVNSAAPSVSGTHAVGSTLTATSGTWSDVDGDTLTYSYQWYRATDAAGTGALAISSATSSSYTLATGDAHKFVRVVVTANDGAGSSNQTAASGWTQLGNAAPTSATPTTASASTFDSGVTAIGTLAATDADGDSLSFSITGITDPSGNPVANDGSVFSVSGSSLRAQNPSGLTAGTYSVTLSGSDGYGGTVPLTVAVTVSNTLVVTTGDNTDTGSTGNLNVSTYAADVADGGGLSLYEALAYAGANDRITFNLAAGTTVDMNGRSMSVGNGAIFDSDPMTTLSITNGTLALNGGFTVTNGTGDALTLSAAIVNDTAQTGTLTKAGAGTMTLSGANTYTGATTLSAGTLATDSLGSSATLALDGGTLKAGTTAGLSYAGGVTAGSGGGTLDLSAGSITLSGAVTGSGGLTVTSTDATKVLSLRNGNGGYSGTTTLQSGILELGSNTALGSGTLQINGGTLQGYQTTARTIANALSLGGTMTLAGSAGLTFTGAVDLGAGTRIIDNGMATAVTFSGVIGNGGLDLRGRTDGTGGITLSGANTYAGTTVITQGQVTAGSAGALGAGGSGSGTTVASGAALLIGGAYGLGEDLTLSGTGIAGAGALRFATSGTATLSGAVTLAADTTIASTNGSGILAMSGAIGGSGGLTKIGGGILELSGNNSYTGATTVSAGFLRAYSSTALGATSAGTTVASGASLRLTDGVTLAENLTIGGTGASGNGVLQMTTGNAAITGTVTLTADVRLAITGGTLTISGDVSGAQAVTKTGAGTLALSGSNSYSGGTTVSAGTLAASATANLGTGGLTLTGATLAITGSGTATIGAAITLGTGGGTVSVGSGTSGVLSGQISGATGLTKTGAGALALTFAGTDALGTTTVSAGTLSVGTGTTTTGDVTVASGATLAGSGTADGAVTVAAGGTLAPAGAGSVGSFTVTGNLTLNGTLALDLPTAGSNDQVVVGGTTVLGAASRIAVTAGAGVAATAVTVIDNQGAGAVTGTLGGVTSTGSALVASLAGGTGNDVTLTAAPPSPGPSGSTTPPTTETSATPATVTPTPAAGATPPTITITTDLLRNITQTGGDGTARPRSEPAGSTPAVAGSPSDLRGPLSPAMLFGGVESTPSSATPIQLALGLTTTATTGDTSTSADGGTLVRNAARGDGAALSSFYGAGTIVSNGIFGAQGGSGNGVGRDAGGGPGGSFDSGLGGGRGGGFARVLDGGLGTPGARPGPLAPAEPAGDGSRPAAGEALAELGAAEDADGLAVHMAFSDRLAGIAGAFATQARRLDAALATLERRA